MIPHRKHLKAAGLAGPSVGSHSTQFNERTKGYTRSGVLTKYAAQVRMWFYYGYRLTAIKR